MESNVKIINFYIRLFVLGVLLAWCFILLRPFIVVSLWSIILATASFPLFLRLKNWLGGRAKLAATVIILLGIGIIIGPVSLIANVFISNAHAFADKIAAGGLILPPPPKEVTTWPLIGQRLDNIWQEASVNFAIFLSQFKPQLQELGKNILSVAANMGLLLLKFLLSIIIAGVLMLNTEALNRGLKLFARKLSPLRGETFIQLAITTIRSVTRGIIGVSVLQTLLIGIGLTVAGIPAAGLLTFVCLILTLIQIGPMIIVLPTLIFAWLSMTKLTALLFTLWMIPATLIDNVLKPILMAQGLPVPIVVILIGVIGGTLAHGVLGLFIGPVVLIVGYELVKAWINEDSDTALIADNSILEPES